MLLETADREHPLGAACASYLANIRGIVRTLADEGGVREAEAFAHSWHILMKGSIVAAAEGDVAAAARAKRMAQLPVGHRR